MIHPCDGQTDGRTGDIIIARYVIVISVQNSSLKLNAKFDENLL